MSGRSPRSGVWNALLLGGSAVLSLVFAVALSEAWYLWTGESSLYRESREQIVRFDSVLGWAPVPDLRLESSQGVIATNSLGFRSAEIDSSDPSRGHVVILGDSVAWGFELADHETISHQLQERLPGIQVHNLGVRGYGLGQSALRLERHVNRLSPLEAVVLIVCTANDMLDAQSNTGQGKRRPFFTVRERKLVEVEIPIRRTALRNVFSELTLVRKIEAASPTGKNWLEKLAGDRELSTRDAATVNRLLLESMNRLATSRGAVFLPVLVPSEDQLDSDANDVTAFRLLLRSATFAYLDLLETMRAQAHGREELYRDNMHFTARGNSVIAERIADALGD